GRGLDSGQRPLHGGLGIARRSATRNRGSELLGCAPMSERPFRVLGVQQIAIGGADKGALRHLWVDLLGLAPTGTYRSEAENVDEDILDCGGVEIDLMQPIDPEKKPAVHQPPLNHIGLWVDDLEAAVAWLTARGVEMTPGEIGRASCRATADETR